MSDVIKESLPKRKRFTVVSVQVQLSSDTNQATVESESHRVLAINWEKARDLITANLEAGSTVIAVFPGYQGTLFIK